MKKNFGFLSASILVTAGLLAGCGNTSNTANESTSATYKATAAGRNGDVTVETTFEGSKITNVTVVEQQETESVASVALERIPQSIVENQSVAIDAVSGATITSNAIIDAVKECITEAGFSVEDYSAKKTVEATSEELETDIVIVGGGGAGLSAAVEAADGGANVILLEKEAILGGSTGLSAGGLLGYPTDENSPAISLDEIKYEFSEYSATSKYYDEEIAEDYFEHLNDTVQWTLDLGYVTNTTEEFGSFMRMDPKDRNSYFKHILVQGGEEGFVLAGGKGLIDVLEKKAEELGVKIMLETPATDLLLDGDKVTGVVATSADNVTYTIHSKQVVLASGGFGANYDLVNEKLGTSYYTWGGGSGDTGDGILMAEKAGAKTEFTTNGVYVPWDIKTLGASTGIMIDNNGLRFTDESLSQIEIGIYSIRDGRQAENNSKDYWVVLEEDSSVVPGVKCDTIADVAELIGAKEETVRSTFERYNELAGKEDADFGKDSDLMNGITMDGPYYLIENAPTAVQTNGGVDVNKNMQVLREDGSVIEGLYSAGEMVNQTVFGDIYPMCGGSINEAVYTGRLAGSNAREALK